MAEPGSKKVVSVRLSEADIKRVKAVAQRLRVYETEVIRFAVKSALARLAPLYDASTRGNDLMPVFADCGPELVAHFQLDERRLQEVVNAGSELTGDGVEPRDLSLLALSGMPESYAYQSLFERVTAELDAENPPVSLRNYLARKYLKT